MHQGKLIIFSAPSGAGKTTLVKHILCELPQISFSISACTRPKRPQEIDGKDYYFLSISDFKQKIKEHAFVEWEEVYAGNFYGTLRTEVERIFANNKHVIFDVDVKGGLQLKQQFGDDALAIFVQPPNFETLEKRLKTRETESDDVIQTRLAKARYELSFALEFDIILMNDDLNQAKKEALNLVEKFLEK